MLFLAKSGNYPEQISLVLFISGLDTNLNLMRLDYTFQFLIYTCSAVVNALFPSIFLIFHHLKPATGRPYVPAFSLSDTVPVFTCDCLRFVCAFTPRREFDLCVSTSSRTMLAFGNNVSCSSSACSTLAFCRQ